jgi:MYXO-CTERM domain-containing protein
MKNTLFIAAAIGLVASFPLSSAASTYAFTFNGPGVSGAVDLSYGPATDAKYLQAFEITGVRGTFSDSNNGLNVVDSPIGSLVTITRDAPEPTNLLAPTDFSKYLVATGLLHGSLSYDNLFYPGGSPQTASDYPVHGGFLDIYGLMFKIGDGEVVDLWSNGDFGGSGTGSIDYGVAVATAAAALDYVSGGVSSVPEPDAYALLLAGVGLIGLTGRRRDRQ